MSDTDSDTIAAIASPPGAGLRGIVRVSGPRARELVLATWAPPLDATALGGDAVLRGAEELDLAERRIAHGRFRDARGTQPSMLLWMPGPRSFTREDVAEFHLLGSPFLLQAALERLVALGARVARPGEFTRRAFLSGRIDLTRAEGVLEIVRAGNERELAAATALLFGGLADKVGELREALEELRGLCEASLDFDASDTGHIAVEELAAGTASVLERMAAAVRWESGRARDLGLPRVVLAGAPNAGKSTLFNALAGRDQALVSARAGTTRDPLRARVTWDGVEVELCDTPGFDPAATGPDADAQELARGARDGSDLVLWVVDASAASDPDEIDRPRLERDAMLLVWNKVDLAGAAPAPPPAWRARVGEARWTAISGRTGGGLDRLARRARELLSERSAAAAGASARELGVRHRAALDRARAEVEQGLTALRNGAALEVLAEHLRLANAELDELSGATTAEEILDRIFSRFCLGK